MIALADRPIVVLTLHSAHKGAQAGAVLGALLAPLVFRLRRHRYYGQSFLYGISGFMMRSAVAGSCVSVALLALKASDGCATLPVGSQLARACSLYLRRESNLAELSERVATNAHNAALDRISAICAVVGAVVGGPTVLIAVSDTGRQRVRFFLHSRRDFN